MNLHDDPAHLVSAFADGRNRFPRCCGCKLSATRHWRRFAKA